ncbi:MAG: hypothetical protein ABIR17_02575 [Pseudolysinimonas sp.]|uniref:glycosyltransferase n=1 Tax=Pseudolysinimonas sp. TaxID=2680009 RepID=UPI00326304E6
MRDTVMLLDEGPAWFRRFAYRIARGEGHLGRLADVARFRYSDDDVPPVPPTAGQAVRLLIGPANSAGQGYEWARSVESHLPAVEAVAMEGIVDPYFPKVDLRVPVGVYQRSGKWHDEFEAFMAGQTHVIWESGLPLLGRAYGSVLIELARLRALGISGALMFHGSDIRPPSRHAAGSLWSPFRSPSGPVHALEENAARNSSLAAESGLPVFVSTPDLLRWVPDAVWCPLVVEPSVWHKAVAPRSPGPLVVVHAPTQMWLKGTERVVPMLNRLAGEGVIDYRQVVGIPHASMPDFYAEADVVLDQFAIGSYGVTACEAMSAGLLVMGHVDDTTRAAVRSATGLELPIHEATIESLEGELRRAAAEPAAFDSLREAGPAFVETVHNGARSAAALAPFLGISA